MALMTRTVCRCCHEWFDTFAGKLGAKRCFTCRQHCEPQLPCKGGRAERGRD